jgi:hypothetical protein
VTVADAGFATTRAAFVILQPVILQPKETFECHFVSSSAR